MSVHRCLEPGWYLAVRDDPSRRRGIWIKETRGEGGRIVQVELCAGREGDDAYVQIVDGQAPTARDLHDLVDCIECGRAPEIDYEEEEYP